MGLFGALWGLWIFLHLSFGRQRFWGRKQCAVFYPAPARGILRSRAKPAWVLREVLRLKALMPLAGCRQVALTFNRLHAVRRQVTVSKSFVALAVRQHRYEVLQLRRRFKVRVPRPLARNQVWGLDLTGKADATGTVHSILGIIDHGSRRVLCLQRLRNKNAWALLGYLFLAIGRFGVPRVIRCDNEPVLVSRVFRAGLRLAGIRQQRSLPGCPWMNGRIERFFGSLKERLNRVIPRNGAALQAMLVDFGFWYNWVRPHQHLSGATPIEAWQGIPPFRYSRETWLWFEAWGGLLSGFYRRC